MVIVAFMFVLLVLSGTFLMGFTSSTLSEAADRQIMLKTQYVHQTLYHTHVENYAVPALQAASEHLVFEEPTVPENYLKSWMEKILEFLRPPNYGIEVRLSHENRVWKVVQPENVEIGEDFQTEHPITFTGTGGTSITVEVFVRTFKISR